MPNDETPPNPNTSLTQPESGIDRLEDQLAPLANRLPGSGLVRQPFNDIVSAMNAEAVADKQMQLEFMKRPEALEGNVDLSAVKTADPTFDEHQFVSIARECFTVVHNARVQRSAALGTNELSPEQEQALTNAINTDEAHHVHHLYPMLEIEDARITKAAVINGLEHIAVHLVVKGEEVDRQEKTMQLVDGDTVMMQWDELWTLRRDPRADSAAIDREMTLMEEQWCFAHQGWVVEDIQTLTPPHPASTPGLLM